MAEREKSGLRQFSKVRRLVRAGYRKGYAEWAQGELCDVLPSVQLTQQAGSRADRSIARAL